VLAAGGAEWASRLAAFKTIALALTVLYFVAGVAWMTRTRSAGAGRE